MAKKTTAARRGGAHRKAATGLNTALYIRVDEKLLEELDELRDQQKKPGIVLSRGDVVRNILWGAIEDAKKEKK